MKSRGNGQEFSGESGLFGETEFCKFSGTQGKLHPRWGGRRLGVSELTLEHLLCDEGGGHAARRRHALSGRWCGDKI